MTLFRFDFDYLKSRYEFELQRKEQLTGQLTLPVAVLGLLGSAIVAMARSFSYREIALTIPFVIFAVLLFSTVAGLPYIVEQVRFFMTRPTQTTSPPAPASQTPQLPTVPPNREIREGDIPTRR